jgi:hypothetical protein
VYVGINYELQLTRVCWYKLRITINIQSNNQLTRVCWYKLRITINTQSNNQLTRVLFINYELKLRITIQFNYTYAHEPTESNVWVFT